MMENLAEDDFQLEHISASRIKNVANAYAWWVVKDSVAITILKVRRCRNVKCRWPNQLTLLGP